MTAATNFTYSHKNIPLCSNNAFKRRLVLKTEDFARRMRWKYFHLVNQTPQQKEKFGFKTLQTPPPADEKVEEFLSELFDLVAEVKFKPAANEFQDRLKEDCRKLRESSKVAASADKTRNLYEFGAENYRRIVLDNVTSCYRKADPANVKQVNAEAANIARELEIDDRVDAMSESQAFINIKDHKATFPGKVEARLINPSKTKIGAVSKKYLDRINSEIRQKTNFHQVKSTGEVLKWFNDLPKTEKSSFFKLDIEAFYPSISEELLLKAIQWARTITTVSQAEEKAILHCRKSFLFWDGQAWVKRDNKDFDVGQGSLDSAEVSELVGLYILSELRRLIPQENTVLYRDDLLAVVNKSARLVDRLRKDVVKLFQSLGLKVTTEINIRSTDFLDVTLNLEDGSHRPFRKDNRIPVYIDSRSNHPPVVKKNLPKMIGKRISDLSSNAEIFEKEKPIYQEALKNAGFKEELKYEKTQKTRRRRRRSILWFNPPWSDTVKTNIGSQFLKLVDKHFKDDDFLGYHFNRQKIKISYSTMPNIKRIITSHNRRLINPKEELELIDCDKKGRCKDECFEERKKCQSRCSIYQASLQYETPHASIPALKIPKSKVYTGLTSNKLKERFNHHHWTFTNERNNPFKPPADRNNSLQNTSLSTHIWKLKERKIEYKLEWNIIKQAPVYSKEAGGCSLCLEEKTQIMFADKRTSLNKRTEIMQKCRHREKHLLKNY